MACSVCGKWSPFQTVCAECRARQRANGFMQSVTKSSLFSRSETKINTRIVINGREVAAGSGDAASLLTPEMLQTMATQAGIPVEQLQSMLAHGNVDVTQLQSLGAPNVTVPQNTEPVVTPHVMVECPKCHHRVKQSAHCMYCGAELPVQQQHTSQREEAKVDDVDRKFLQSDVRPDEQKEEEEQPLHDTFSDRLREL